MAYLPVATLDDLWSGEMRACEAGGRRILLLRDGDTVMAYEDRCAHFGARLSEGTFERGVITCAVHHWKYDAASGRGINPASACLVRFPVAIEGGRVLVDPEAGAPP